MFYYFISDLHLSEERPEITRAFLDFAKNEAPQASALYILGDLFEFWNGDDTQGSFANSICNALLKLSQQGTPVFFLYGNRDFLVSRKFAKRCGVSLLKQESIVEMFGNNYLLMHGDSLCTDDHAYQRFRRITESKILRFIYRNLPFSIRLKLSASVRGKSQNDNQNKAAAIMDVNPLTVLDKLNTYSCNTLIHGHTHRQATHNLDLISGQQGQRIVLGDWHDSTSILKVDSSGLQFINAPICNS
ncbi:UDP-2,3-diacylglucosamine diphosphatase [Alginatibacterium sediminis]|uniref:UDP-2,3-diacylglucosamine hydrolase n=1 Tax=Alginatibacterium sediminis TaxID=2164068 RepID=A0A420EAZ3_9ALTE|nr:UDP-2,3-diacylglucosamine diphosphatase [Alginatibacterium sediminis]RKF17858.1 UDP-2,3-diacylglucosamine diphosphatase [Alginatibacterium sediminis]